METGTRDHKQKSMCMQKPQLLHSPSTQGLLRICRCSSEVFQSETEGILTTLIVSIIPFKQHCCIRQEKIHIVNSSFSEGCGIILWEVLEHWALQGLSWLKCPIAFGLPGSSQCLLAKHMNSRLFTSYQVRADMEEDVFSLWSAIVLIHSLFLLAPSWEERSNTIKTKPPKLSCERFLAHKRPERVIKFLWCPIFFKGWVFPSINTELPCSVYLA